jgi:hypothetical protein
MLVAVCSLKGSPGVTTAAVALAARWPMDHTPLVVECDPAGGDLLARFGLARSPDLVSVAAAARRDASADLLWRHTQRLPGGLPVVAGPVGAEQARAALRVVTIGQARLLRLAADQPGVVVIADCGRVDPDSSALPVIRAADAMLLLAHARSDELAHVAGKVRLAAIWNPRPGLVLVGGGYPTHEVARELRITVVGRLPHDLKGASVLCGQRSGALVLTARPWAARRRTSPARSPPPALRSSCRRPRCQPVRPARPRGSPHRRVQSPRPVHRWATEFGHDLA